MDPRSAQAERLTIDFQPLMARRFREDLPPACPPLEAQPIVSRLVVYRLTQKPKPSEEDFHSQRRVRPHQIFQVGERVVRSLSVWLTDQDCELARSLPAPGNRFVARVELLRGVGYVSQTGLNEAHVPLVTSMVEGLAQRCPRPGGGRAAVGQRNWIRRSSRTRTRSVRRLKKINRLQ